MAEINLICPGCGAEYALPVGTIPAEGREVECSDCGHVWHAALPAPDARLDLAGFARPAPTTEAPPAFVPASQRLPASVLDLLRDEVEHERRQREAQDPASDPSPTPQQTLPDEVEWPATTLTTPEPGTAMVPLMAPGPIARDLARPAPLPWQPAARTDGGRRDTARDRVSARAQATDATAPRPAIVIRHGQQSIPTEAPAPPTPHQVRPARGYGLGLSLMLLLAAGVVGFYLWAPDAAAEGTPIATLHDRLDLARIWLDTQAARLIR